MRIVKQFLVEFAWDDAHTRFVAPLEAPMTEATKLAASLQFYAANAETCCTSGREPSAKVFVLDQEVDLVDRAALKALRSLAHGASALVNQPGQRNQPQAG